MIDPFKPSDVVLLVPPLVGTMGKAEREAAAALLVRALAVRGDEWRSVEPREIGEVLMADLEAKVEPWASLDRNPFFRPDWDRLGDGVFARFVGVPGDRRAPIEFTAEGIEAMRRWVKP